MVQAGRTLCSLCNCITGAGEPLKGPKPNLPKLGFTGVNKGHDHKAEFFIGGAKRRNNHQPINSPLGQSFLPAGTRAVVSGVHLCVRATRQQLSLHFPPAGRQTRDPGHSRQWHVLSLVHLSSDMPLVVHGIYHLLETKSFRLKEIC